MSTMLKPESVQNAGCVGSAASSILKQPMTAESLTCAPFAHLEKATPSGAQPAPLTTPMATPMYIKRHRILQHHCTAAACTAVDPF